MAKQCIFPDHHLYSGTEESDTVTNRRDREVPRAGPARQALAELARKIDLYMGSQVKRVTDIPGLTLVRRTELTAPACMTYEPSIAVIAQSGCRPTCRPPTSS